MTVLSLKGAEYSGDWYWVGRVLLIVCLLLAVPASALAAPVTLRDGVLTYAPTDVRSSAQLFYGSYSYAVVDGANAEPGEGCVWFAAAIRCDHGGAQAAIVLRFGPQNDFALMRDLTGYLRSSVHAGDGTDRLELGRGPDLAHGGPGHDTLDGGEGDDDLRGDEGSDRLVGGAGADRLDGGPGIDQVDYYYEFGRSGDNGERPGGVRVTVGSGSDDGAPGEGDDVVEAERVRGTRSRDVLVGSAGDDELDGAEAGDVLRGGGGRDRLIADAVGMRIVDSRVMVPERGIDVLSGGAGSDVIDLGHYMEKPARVENDEISCGSGRDTVFGGWLAVAHLPADCERLCAGQFGCATLAKVPRTTRNLRLRGRIVRVPVTCPSLPMPQHKCAGRIVLTAHGKRLGQTRFNLANGATARYRIRLRHPVGKLVATVESGPNALWRTTLAVFS